MDKIRNVDRQGFVREYFLTALTLVSQRKNESGYGKIERGEVVKGSVVTRYNVLVY